MKNLLVKKNNELRPKNINLLILAIANTRFSLYALSFTATYYFLKQLDSCSSPRVT